MRAEPDIRSRRLSGTVHDLRVELGSRSYPIWIGPDLLHDAARWRSAIPGRHALIVTNATVAPLYLARVAAGLDGKTFSTLVLPDGEAHKTFDSVERVFGALADLKASRDATVLALGGGVIGDLAGFAAACWMRGVNLLQMPTTLLAQVDSSVGGKTAVNLAQGKNLVGAFHQPRAVVIDTSTLATLPEREFRSGLAEVVKYGALGDAAFFNWLENNSAALATRDAAAIAAAIRKSCGQKAAIVGRDEREDGERALLNFGHTFAHALETASGYGVLLHGEAVSIGMLLAARLSTRLCGAPPADAERLAALLRALGLPSTIPGAATPDALIELMRLDKKILSGRLRLILWQGIGHAQIVPDVDLTAIRELLVEQHSA